MTKADVVSKISDQTGINKSDVLITVESFVNVIKSSMESGDDIFIRGFGSFVNKKRAKKVARNISKNTAIVIAAHFVPTFKPAKEFVDKVKKSPKLKV
ncbi:MAG: HU family DNA-binding protein [Cytophagales bacterium]|nr:HU family DNA-binding protein [Cytophagales bacterium]